MLSNLRRFIRPFNYSVIRTCHDRSQTQTKAIINIKSDETIIKVPYYSITDVRLIFDNGDKIYIEKDFNYVRNVPKPASRTYKVEPQVAKQYNPAYYK